MGSRDEAELFFRAIDLPEQERIRFLEDATGGDPEKLGHLLEMLGAHDRLDDSFLESSSQTPQVDPPGIDGYHITDLLGQGAFGAVFLAHERGSIDRDVAIKVLHQTDDRAQRRFLAERQLLAELDHPGIATVHAAGETKTGDLYFVMEWIDGLPITTHADRYRWSIERRLELFLDVCSAVAHAHRRGVIHADLKPSNILVRRRDDRPRVIDFGVARTVADSSAISMAKRSLFGTPAYMSPEQARGAALDTRSDVFSLGVLLFELLTGDCAVGDRMNAARRVQIARRRSEGETVPVPSETFVRHGVRSHFGQTRAARRRATMPRALRGRLRGDLDAIVACATDADPERRYRSVDALCEDLQRSLACRPLTIRDRRPQYVIRQAIRRQPVTFGLSALTLGAVILGTVEGTRATRAETEARTAQRSADRWKASTGSITDYFVDVFEGVQASPNGPLSAVDMIRDAAEAIGDRFDTEPAVEARLRFLLGAVFFNLSEQADAVEQFQIVRGLGVEAADDQLSTGMAFRALLRSVEALYESDRVVEADELLEAARAEADSTEGDLDPADLVHLLLLESHRSTLFQRLDEAMQSAERALETARTAGLVYEEAEASVRVSTLLGLRGDFARAEEVLRSLTKEQVSTLDESRRARWDVVDSQNVLLQMGELDPTDETRLRTALEEQTALYGPSHSSPRRIGVMLARLLIDKGELVEAERLLRLEHSVLAEETPDDRVRLRRPIINLAMIDLRRGDSGRALRRLRMVEPADEDDSQSRAQWHAMLGTALGVSGRADEAIEELERALALESQDSGSESARSLLYLDALGMLLSRSDRTERAIEVDRRVVGAPIGDGIRRANALVRLGRNLLRAGELDEAEDCLEQAVEIGIRLAGAEGRFTRVAANILEAVYRRQGDAEAIAELRQRVPADEADSLPTSGRSSRLR